MRSSIGALEKLRNTSGLLFLFWTGHGIMTADGNRRPLLANYSDAGKNNVDLDSLKEHLRSSFGQFQYPKNQILTFDICATLFDERLRREDLPGHRYSAGPAVPHCQQFLRFASEDGQAAENVTSERTGRYFKELMELLDRQSGWPPTMENMEEINVQLKSRFKELVKEGLAAQRPIRYSCARRAGRETKNTNSCPLI